MSDFDGLKHCLAEWPRQEPPREPATDHASERLRRVLLGIWDGQLDLGVGDLAGLIQHVIRRQATLLGATKWKLPLGTKWPDAALWRKSGLCVLTEGEHEIVVAVRGDWTASWLSGSEAVPPLAAALREDQRRLPSQHQLPLDSAVKIECMMSNERYMCSGQQQAVQAAMTMQPGTTLVVNLPTGSGKSLVFQSAAMLANPNELTVIVMPTVALALDQEQKMQLDFAQAPSGQLPNRLAWHSSLSPDEKTEIRRRLRAGTQRILFAAPEAIDGSLCREIYQTAREGRLKYFAIDEAHLVAQWGTEFRPEFQAISGLRRELIKVSPKPEQQVRTLLLSATLTEESFEVLQTLFADEVFDVVSAVHLRPEPEYWVSQARNEAEKTERVLELVRVVPRPFLLYVTKRDDSEKWSRCLREQAGIKRLGCVHGGTDGATRQQVIEQWRNGDIDCVVATSAFGLGMDKEDVRTVIHACMPETVDRLYQEVGRGGRDGKACVSFVIFTERDIAIAKGLGTECFISIDRGLERWADMMDRAKGLGDGLWRLDLSTVPADKAKDSGANRAWNLRTVLMLNRAGLIRIESAPPPDIERGKEEDEFAFNDRRQVERDEYANSCFVRVMNDCHRDEATWQQVVEPMRQLSYERDRRGFEDIKAALSGHVEMMDVLAKTYEVSRWGISPQRVCGGCSCCRHDEMARRQCRPPVAEASQHPLIDIKPKLRDLMKLSGNNLLFVSCPTTSKDIERQLIRTHLPRLIEWGITELAVPDHWWQQKPCREWYRKSPHRFVIQRSMTDFDEQYLQLKVPRVTVFFPDDDRPFDRRLLLLDRPLHIVFLPESIKDSGRRGTQQTPLDDFFERASHVSYVGFLGRLQS